MQEIVPLYFSNAAAWRKWLSSNHQSSSEAWVVHLKVGSKLPGLRYSEALEEALNFGWIDGKLKSIDQDKFMLRYSPRKNNSIWSQKNRLKAEELTRAGRMAEPGLAAIDAAKDNGNWGNAYTDKESIVVPDDLQAALDLNKAALLNFAGFPTSSRNIYIRWINQAKTPGKRLERIASVVERASSNLKPGSKPFPPTHPPHRPYAIPSEGATHLVARLSPPSFTHHH